MVKEETKVKLQRVQNVLRRTGGYCITYKKWLLALPVVLVAVYLAIGNAIRLPEEVGFLLNAKGTFSVTISHGAAVWLPLLLTGLCLALMGMSRKLLYPWLVSWITCLIPLLLRFLNQWW